MPKREATVKSPTSSNPSRLHTCPSAPAIAIFGSHKWMTPSSLITVTWKSKGRDPGAFQQVFGGVADAVESRRSAAIARHAPDQSGTGRVCQGLRKILGRLRVAAPSAGHQRS